jgi:hypothetical protein
VRFRLVAPRRSARLALLLVVDDSPAAAAPREKLARALPRLFDAVLARSRAAPWDLLPHDEIRVAVAATRATTSGARVEGCHGYARASEPLAPLLRSHLDAPWCPPMLDLTVRLTRYHEGARVAALDTVSCLIGSLDAPGPTCPFPRVFGAVLDVLPAPERTTDGSPYPAGDARPVPPPITGEADVAVVVLSTRDDCTARGGVVDVSALPLADATGALPADASDCPVPSHRLLGPYDFAARLGRAAPSAAFLAIVPVPPALEHLVPDAALDASHARALRARPGAPTRRLLTALSEIEAPLLASTDARSYEPALDALAARILGTGPLACVERAESSQFPGAFAECELEFGARRRETWAAFEEGCARRGGEAKLEAVDAYEVERRCTLGPFALDPSSGALAAADALRVDPPSSALARSHCAPGQALLRFGALPDALGERAPVVRCARATPDAGTAHEAAPP